MKSLGKLLRKHINDNGYTIYKIASRADINRTTLQKVLSDDRAVTKELLNKLLSVLKLSPMEEKEIRTMFEISQVGETLYNQRQYIKELIRNASDFDKISSPPSLLSESPGTYSPTACCLLQESYSVFSSCHMVSGVHNVEQLVSSCIFTECQNKPSAICMNIPGNFPLLRNLFLYNLPLYAGSCSLTLKHITPMLKSPGQTTCPLVNLEILSNILPFTLSRTFHYDIYYFYGNELLADPILTAFPYFFLFDEMVVLLSPDGTTALPCSDYKLLLHFRDLFAIALKQAVPFITTIPSAGSTLKHLIQIDQSTRTFRTIECQPCFAAFLTEELIRKYTRPDLPDRETLIKAAAARSQQLTNMKNRFCLFSKNGLIKFARHGVISEFPSDYMFPVDVPDRILLLNCLYEACEQEKEFLRLANPVTFPIPDHLLFIIRADYGADFHFLHTDNTNFNYIHIAEPTILEAFEDFYDYLMNSDMLYTKQETLDEIRQLSLQLEQSIPDL